MIDSTANHREQPDPPRSRESSDEPPKTPSYQERSNPLMLSFLLFIAICFAVWVVSAGKRYREEYAQATEGWRVGTSRVVEITLVKEDMQRLACTANQDFWGLRCNVQRDGIGADPDPQTLQPFNTVSNQLLLGAGLWNSPDLQRQLPEGRFTVICNYHIKGVVKSARIRFSSDTSFAPLEKTVTAGILADCVVPR